MYRIPFGQLKRVQSLRLPDLTMSDTHQNRHATAMPVDAIPGTITVATYECNKILASLDNFGCKLNLLPQLQRIFIKILLI